jgi:hypothetical protein
MLFCNSSLHLSYLYYISLRYLIAIYIVIIFIIIRYFIISNNRFKYFSSYYDIIMQIGDPVRYLIFDIRHKTKTPAQGERLMLIRQRPQKKSLL